MYEGTGVGVVDCNFQQGAQGNEGDRHPFLGFLNHQPPCEKPITLHFYRKGNRDLGRLNDLPLITAHKTARFEFDTGLRGCRILSAAPHITKLHLKTSTSSREQKFAIPEKCSQT